MISPLAAWVFRRSIRFAGNCPHRPDLGCFYWTNFGGNTDFGKRPTVTNSPRPKGLAAHQPFKPDLVSKNPVSPCGNRGGYYAVWVTQRGSLRILCQPRPTRLRRPSCRAILDVAGPLFRPKGPAAGFYRKGGPLGDRAVTAPGRQIQLHGLDTPLRRSHFGGHGRAGCAD